MTAPVLGNHISETFTGSATHTTAGVGTNTGDMVVVCIHSEHPTNAQSVSTVTDTIGNSYTRRTANSWTSTAQSNAKNNQEIWYAKSTGTNAANQITATLVNAADDAGMAVFTVTGQNAVPWDSNASLPGLGSNPADVSSTETISSLTTTYANSFIIGFYSTSTNNSPTVGTIAGATATLINSWANSGGTNYSKGLVEYAPFTAVQTNFSVSTNGGTGNWGLVADVITADGVPLRPSARGMVVT